MKRSRLGPLLAGWMVALTSCEDGRPDPDVVARAGDHQLRVDEVVELLADREEYPARADVVEGLAALWIDYTLLATAAARDSTLSNLDLGPLARQRLDQEGLMALGDSAIQLDTIVSDQEVAARYEEDVSNVRFRASHIMMTYPSQATAAERDSVRTRLTELRAQLDGGASFADFARRFSQDRGSAEAGGDIGTFGPGEMVRPFEQAVMALEPGEISEVVETPMGLHIIRLDERRRPEFVEAAPGIRNRLLTERASAAESIFVAAVEERAGAPELVEGARDAARELARAPGARLSARAARRPLVTWAEGALTAGSVLDVLRFEDPSFHEQVANAEDEAVEGLLLALARREMLVAESRRMGLAPPAERMDSMTDEMSRELLGVARALGLHPLDRAPGEALVPAVARAVLAALADNVSGATPPVPLGPLGYQLRAATPHATFNAGIGRAVLRIGQVRASRGASDEEQGAPPPPTRDTTGGS